LSGLALRAVEYEGRGAGREVFERAELTDSGRLRPGYWNVAAAGEGGVNEGGRLPTLAMLATEPLQEDEFEDTEIREVRRERAAAVI
jgi:hypothetical protein